MSNNLTRIGVVRARKMLDALTQYPFVIFVFEDDKMVAYCKGVDDEAKQLISETLEALA